MSKKRRTRKQKVIASTRQTPLVISTHSGETQFTIEAPIAVSEPRKASTALAVPSYSYVLHDAQKTLVITAVLVVIDLVIFYTLKLKILNIPGIGF
jgi:hypothetical protein